MPTTPSEPATLAEALSRAARTAEGVRFRDRGSERFVTYREIQDRAARRAAALIERGVRPGDRVAILLPTGLDFYEAFFGSSLAGAVPVPLYPPPRFGSADTHRQRSAGQIASVSARLVLSLEATRRRLEEAVERSQLGGLTLSELGEADSVAGIAAEPDELALIQFSSGTTDRPKPVGLTHRQLLANVQSILDWIFTAFPEDEDLRHEGVSWLPLYHDMGLVGAMLTALVRPGPLTLLPPELFVARPASWLRAISERRATISAAPNFAYRMCLERIDDGEMEGVDLSSWRLALNGAEPVAVKTMEAFHRKFRAFGLREEALTPVYGMAETSLAVTCSDPRERFRYRRLDRSALVRNLLRPAENGDNAFDVVSLGPPLPGMRIRIVDEGGGGGELPDGTLGRVLVRSPSIMRGYFGLEEETRRVLRHGWLDTGDRGFVLDGELYLHGRHKEMILHRGRNFAPRLLEELLEGIEGLRSGAVAVVGAPSEDGERLTVFAEREPGGKGSDAETIERIVTRLVETLGLRPDEVVLLDPGALPRTSSGKIQRRELAAGWTGRTGTGTESSFEGAT